jgi:hypothetical protein
MNLLDLIAWLDAQHVRLSARLVVDAPDGVLTPEVREALASHRPALLARLTLTREAGTYAGTIFWDGLGRPGAPCLLRVRRPVPMPAGAAQGPATIATCILWHRPDPYAIAEREAIQAEGNPCGLNTRAGL